MLAEPRLSKLVERFGLRVWQTSVEIFGYPPTWDLSHKQILHLQTLLET